MWCTFAGCVKPLHSRGLCKSHYKQQWLGKSLKPLTQQFRNLSPEVRFKKYVRVNTKTGCWEWLGYVSRRGYGMFAMGDVQIRAHRAAWLLFRGLIPPDPQHKYGTQHVLHVCDVKACVNPDHLFLGTAYENMHDAMRKGVRMGQHGPPYHRARLSAQQVYEIWVSTEHPKDLAQRFGLHKTTVYDIKLRRTWTYLDLPESERGDWIRYPKGEA
jgi:hypothetical protein